MNGWAKLGGVVLVVGVVACDPQGGPDTVVPRSLAIVEASDASAHRCAGDLEALAVTDPDITWNALQPALRLHGGGPVEEGDRQRLARRDRDEVVRRVREVESIGQAVLSLAERQGVERYLDLVGLAERSRDVSSALCRSRDTAYTVAMHRPPATAPGRDGAGTLAGNPTR
jgi:hypothetical protein